MVKLHSYPSNIFKTVQNLLFSQQRGKWGKKVGPIAEISWGMVAPLPHPLFSFTPDRRRGIPVIFSNPFISISTLGYICGFSWGGKVHLFTLIVSTCSARSRGDTHFVLWNASNASNSFCNPPLKVPNHFLNEISEITEKSTFLLTHFDDCF